MRRATGITLVLMGGGLAVGLATCGGGGRASAAECQEARKQNRPDAERICSSGGGRVGSGGSGGYGGQHGSHSDRGGFGHTGAAHASFGG